MSRVHIATKCDTALSWVSRNTPATLEVDWMNGSQHNKKQTDAQRFLLLLERNVFSPLPPKLWIFNVYYYRSFEAQKNGILTSPTTKSFFSVRQYLPKFLLRNAARLTRLYACSQKCVSARFFTLIRFRLSVQQTCPYAVWSCMAAIWTHGCNADQRLLYVH